MPYIQSAMYILCEVMKIVLYSPRIDCRFVRLYIVDLLYFNNHFAPTKPNTLMKGNHEICLKYFHRI